MIQNNLAFIAKARKETWSIICYLLRLFADDTCIFVTVNQRNQDSALVTEDLLAIQKWADDWLVTFSPPKTRQTSKPPGYDQ